MSHEAAEPGAFAEPTMGVPFDVMEDVYLPMPIVPRLTGLVAWGAVVLPERAFPWVAALEQGFETGLQDLALGQNRHVGELICPVCPRLVQFAFDDAARWAVHDALKRRCGPERRSWAFGVRNSGVQGCVVVGIAVLRLWTGRIRLGDILMRRGDGRDRFFDARTKPDAMEGGYDDVR